MHVVLLLWCREFDVFVSPQCGVCARFRVVCTCIQYVGQQQECCVQERAQRLEVQLHKARAEAVKREAELTEQRDARGEPETFQELKKFAESYNTVRASLDRCLASLEVLTLRCSAILLPDKSTLSVIRSSE